MNQSGRVRLGLARPGSLHPRLAVAARSSRGGRREVGSNIQPIATPHTDTQHENASPSPRPLVLTRRAGVPGLVLCRRAPVRRRPGTGAPSGMCPDGVDGHEPGHGTGQAPDHPGSELLSAARQAAPGQQARHLAKGGSPRNPARQVDASPGQQDAKPCQTA